ncbi:MAG: FAD-dependent oxidoreductase [Thermoleophilia bacterium]|nr:FAD-dependent oxidoreductase [Thermoleophilia bacterium]
MDKDQTFVIVGASLTGAKAAEELRERGFDGRVILLGAEPERPYERPSLSKDFLRGEADGKPYVHEEGFYAEKNIDLRTGVTVTAIDPLGSSVTVDGSEEIGFDRLLIATGAEPRRLDLPGAGLDGVVYLRTVADSEARGRRFGDGVRVVVVGAGWIGSEVAASARQKGCDVTMIAPESAPLERVLGPELGKVYLDVHEDHGVRFLAGTGVTGFLGSGSAEAVLTDSNERIEADLVVVGAGVLPRTALAEAARISTDNGILTGASLETEAPGIFAAGDVANAFHPFYNQRIRVEHWANARRQGAAAARSMLGEPVEFDEIPYFFSDQYDVGMEYVGYAPESDGIVYRGDVDTREFIAFWVKDGQVVAGMNVNVWDVSDPIRDLIRSRNEVDAGQLADSEVDLVTLAG